MGSGAKRPPGGVPVWARKTQLSGATGVTSHVASIAVDQGVLLGGASARTAEAAESARVEMTEAPVLELLSDAEVMLRVAAGDDGAFDYLVEKFRRPMVSFMYRMTRNQSVAEELAQEVFLRVYRSRQTYAASAKFTTWLYRIATNLAVNHARDTKYERPENTVNIDEPDTETGLTRGGAAGEATGGSDHAQVPKHGLQADRGRAEAKRIGDQVVALPGV